jgi:acetoin utilization deacetylase AcuC-like enzyme
MVNIGEHVFPVEKYRLIYEELLRMGAKKDDFLLPPLPGDEDLLLVHTPRFIKRLKSGTLSHSEILILELPYSPELLNLHCGSWVEPFLWLKGLWRTA